MIRKLSLIMSVLALTALCVAAAPILVQADIFLKPHSKDDDGKEGKKPTLYIPFMSKKDKSKDAGSSASYYKQNKVKIVQHTPNYEAAPVDPKLLSMAGPEPQTVEELKAIASAYMVPQLKALRELQVANAAFVERERLKYERQQASADTTGRYQKQQSEQQAEGGVTKEAPKKRIYNTPGLTKPRKVFTDYR